MKQIEVKGSKKKQSEVTVKNIRLIFLSLNITKSNFLSLKNLAKSCKKTVKQKEVK
ncbi:hypothetical protein [Cellvibrio sp.]|uniref:hypothetical protein n=1 Tax=Cellvibrio sp. TaxID=1965322 RepID=UPI0039647EBE